MSDDWVEDVARLRDEVDKTTQRFEDAAEHIEPVDAKDSSGSITVVLDKEGALQEVKVVSTWRKALEPSMLAAAVQEAIMAAAAQRTEVWGTRLAEQSREPEPVVRPMESPVDSLAAQLTELTTGPGGPPTAVLEELLGMFKAINAGMDQASAEVKARGSREYAGRSTSGHVRATVLGSGTITQLSFDQRWIEKAHHFNIGRESTEAIRDAAQKVSKDSVQGIIDASPLGEVLALAKDPNALVERLRLRE